VEPIIPPVPPSESTGSDAAFRVTAPGRVNLIGEHTDYNDGFVLPIAIERGISMTVRRRPDRLAVLRTDRDASEARFDLAVRLVPGRRDWSAYPAGVLAGCQRLGWEIPGFEASISADLPAGAGLSSSAALEVATATAVEALCGRSLPPEAKAAVCQQAEHQFAGVPCGIMDQFAVTMGRAGHAILLDCRSREIRHVPLDDRRAAVLVIDSGVKHRLADGHYAARRAECESAARLLSVGSLRDVAAAELASRGRALPAVERARAAHVITENARTLAFAAAAARGDWPAAGRLMFESHASLAGDYEVSCPELDLIVGIAARLPGVHGCRMTGGGFGGCAVALIDPAHAAAIMEAVGGRYRDETGIEPVMFVTRAAGGPRIHAA
jgi:galactokinase